MVFDCGEECWILERNKSSYLLYCDAVGSEFTFKFTKLHKLSRFLCYKLKTGIQKKGRGCNISVEFETKEPVPGPWEYEVFFLKFNNGEQQTVEVHRTSFSEDNNIVTDFYFDISPQLLGLWTPKQRCKRKINLAFLKSSCE